MKLCQAGLGKEKRMNFVVKLFVSLFSSKKPLKLEEEGPPCVFSETQAKQKEALDCVQKYGVEYEQKL